MKRYTSGTILKGILFGTLVPIGGYLIAFALFDVIARISESGALIEYTSDFRPRTLCLVGLMCNLIPFHYFIRQGETRTVRGIVAPTLIYALIWFFYFRESIFAS
ncbi:MAG: hypothetical protein GVX96_05185 [Bacteroidetes bacterium]|jgi:hypothetical protein|nr:hypothetical protein [Bacteroidota bacterium]